MRLNSWINARPKRARNYLHKESLSNLFDFG